jgi:transposase
MNYTILPCNSKNQNVQTYKISYNVDDKALALAGEGDGVLVYTSNHTEQSSSDKSLYEMPASQIVHHYKDKYVIEDCFRSLKTFGDLRPFFVRKEDHIKAHVDIVNFN